MIRVAAGTEAGHEFLERLVERAAAETGSTPELIWGRNRQQATADARHAVVYVMIEDQQWTRTALGDAFGRDRSTFSTALTKARRRIAADQQFRELVGSLRRIAVNDQAAKEMRETLQMARATLGLVHAARSALEPMERAARSVIMMLETYGNTGPGS